MSSHRLFGFDLHTLLLAAGALLGHLLMGWRAAGIGLDARRAAGFSATILVAAAYGGHILYLALEDGAAQLAWNKPILFIDPFAGGVSLGCLGGAAIGGAFYLWRYGLEASSLFNAGAWVFPFAWILVRTGCYITHEPLALIEVVYSVALATTFWFGRSRPWPFAAILLVSYGAIRVAVHAQRIGPHLTDQVGAWLTLGTGLAWWYFDRRHTSVLPPGREGKPRLTRQNGS